MSELKVTGATLYYEIRGTGPLLVMIPGGPTDAGSFAGLAAALADRYTTVAIDPRGNSRSKFDGEPVEQDLDVHGDDAARLIAELGGEAIVLGSSGGAQIGANVAARHPAAVRLLIAHEPPCVPLLPDGEATLRDFERIHGVYLREGVRPAMIGFAGLAGLDMTPPPADMPPQARAAMARIAGNMDYFLNHGIRQIAGYRPDVAALRGRVVVGVGRDSAGQLAERCARVLARELGVEPVVFPGDHTGFGPHPVEFARVLHAAIAPTA